MRQSRKRRLYNRLNKKTAKFAIRAVRESKTFEEAQEKLRLATQVLDRISAKNVIHKNTAANRKSSLAKYVNKLKTTAVQA
ncbi:30S ribosomal protein S20 [Candidatus Kapaibacterium sp.]